MKFLILFVLTTFTTQSFALTGTGIAGAVTLGGLFKALLLKSKIPLGGVTSFYGYEALAYPQSTPVYCYAGIGISSESSIIGLSFGGQFNKIKTVGRCDQPEDYAGGFLSIGVSYEFGESGSSKKINTQTAFNLSFDLETFNQRIERDFTGPSHSDRTFQQRIHDVAWHFIKYSGRAAKEKIGKNIFLLKLLTLPFLSATGPDWKLALKEMKFNNEDMANIQNKKNMSSIKASVADLFYQIRKDPNFYINHSPNAVDVYVDAFYLMDAIEEALGECHSLSATVSPMSSYDVRIPFLDSKFGFSYSYSYYGQRNILEGNVDTALAAGKAFSLHRFSAKSPSCENIEKTAAKSFGKFLSIFQ